MIRTLSNSTAVTSPVSHLNNGNDYYNTTNDVEINNSCSKVRVPILYVTNSALH